MARTFSQISFDFGVEETTLPETPATLQKPAKVYAEGSEEERQTDGSQGEIAPQDGKEATLQDKTALAGEKDSALTDDATLQGKDGSSSLADTSPTRAAQQEKDSLLPNHSLQQIKDDGSPAESSQQESDETPALQDSPTAEKHAPSPTPRTGRGRKSQKTYAAQADLVEVPDDEILFQRQYYSIGEVSQMFNVNPSLLRFWESEFDIIKPRKNRKGDRHFRPADIKNLQLIYDLLRRRKLTIDGARDFLRNSKKAQERFEMIQSLQKIRSFLLEIRASL